MKIFLLIIIVVILLYGYRVYASKPQLETEGGFVTTKDIPLLVKTLQKEGNEGAFWVILIPGTSKSDDYDANLQFSVDKNAVGMDWVLIAERNKLDKEIFVKVVESHNLTVKKLSGNGVEYLRVEGSENFPMLAEEVLRELYGINSDIEMPLIITGLDWKKS